jgi:ABC-type uncharacterized transport system substrate-binding protein
VIGRRRFIEVIAGGFLAAPLAAEAQSAKVPRVGLLGLGSAESSLLFEVLRQGLRERGWIEGRNITFEDRAMVDNYSRLPAVAAELVRLKIDVIVAWGTTTALAARGATWTIPIVTIIGSDPVEMGVVTSLARPGRCACRFGLRQCVAPRILRRSLRALPRTTRRRCPLYRVTCSGCIELGS